MANFVRRESFGTGETRESVISVRSVMDIVKHTLELLHNGGEGGGEGGAAGAAAAVLAQGGGGDLDQDQQSQQKSRELGTLVGEDVLSASLCLLCGEDRRREVCASSTARGVPRSCWPRALDATRAAPILPVIYSAQSFKKLGERLVLNMHSQCPNGVFFCADYSKSKC